MGNRFTKLVTRIEDYELILNSGVLISLLDCWYLPDMDQNIISLYALYKDEFHFYFDNNNGLKHYFYD